MACWSSTVRDINEFLADLGLVPPEGEVRTLATYHDACHLVHAQRVREAPRKLLAQVPGLELRELPESELCCGAAGTYNLTQPEMSARLGERKIANIFGTKARLCITANAGCVLQISREARQQKMRLLVAHPMEVLDWKKLTAHPAYEALHMEQTIYASQRKEILTTRCPIRINGRALTSSKAAPALGAHTEEIINNLINEKA